jgi:molecular chaperone GrpE
MNEKEELTKEQPAEKQPETGAEAQQEQPSQSEKTESDSKKEEEVCFDYQEIDKMMAIIEEKNRLVEENGERYKRLQADFENFRRRTRQEKEDLSRVIAQNIITDFLPVLDNFERALTNAKAQDSQAILSGVEMIFRQFLQALEKNGLTTIEAVGKVFDPKQHEAVMRVEDDSKEDGTVVEELQKGYIVHDKVIRPSMVKVTGQ